MNVRWRVLVLSSTSPFHGSQVVPYNTDAGTDHQLDPSRRKDRGMTSRDHSDFSYDFSVSFLPEEIAAHVTASKTSRTAGR